MNDTNYNLDFNQALKEMVENNAWVKGQNFKEGLYMKVDNMGKLVLVDVNNFYREEDCPYIVSLYRQKFRLITIATKKELSK